MSASTWAGTANLDILSVCALLPEGAHPKEALSEDPKPLPPQITDFDRNERLGRKGTSTFDRVTSLALAACSDALREAARPRPDHDTDRFGVVSATTTASLKSVTDYSRATLEEERPYLVNPLLFPNTVMNCAAGQAAIRFGLKGPNATVAGADIAGIQALHYALRLAHRGYLDEVMVFGAEEITDEYRALHSWSRAAQTTAAECAASAVLAVSQTATRPRIVSSAVVTRLVSSDEQAGQAMRRCLRTLSSTPDSPKPAVAVLTTTVDNDVRSVLEEGAEKVVDLVAWAGHQRAAQGLVGLGVAFTALTDGTVPADSTTLLVGQGNEDQFGTVLVEGPRS